MLTNRPRTEAMNNQGVTGKRKTRVTTLALLLLGSLTIAAGTTALAESHHKGVHKKKSHETESHEKQSQDKDSGEKGGWKKAQLTTYTSYPACCKGSEAYNPKADKSECDDYSGCKYAGELAALGHKSFSWVKGNDIISFYDDRDKGGKDFDKKYGGKKIKLRKNGKEFAAIIADTCGNEDCDNCCTHNSKGGFLVDMEYWTAQRQLGGADKADGTIEFQILD